MVDGARPVHYNTWYTMPVRIDKTRKGLTDKEGLVNMDKSTEMWVARVRAEYVMLSGFTKKRREKLNGTERVTGGSQLVNSRRIICAQRR